TKSGTIVGTPCYMAPEQAFGDPKRIGPKADVYSLGVILYEMITGRPPFTGDSMVEVLDLVRHQEPVPPSRLRSRLPASLETICLKCLQKDPERRYSTANDLAEDLRRFLDHKPIVARPVSRPERFWLWTKRHPAVAALSAVLSTVVVVSLAIVSWQ